MTDEQDPLKFELPDPFELLASDPAEPKKEEAPARPDKESGDLDELGTFASPEAPWVGQEQAWIERGGVDPAPKERPDLDTPEPDMDARKRFSSTPPPIYASLVDVKADLQGARPLPTRASIMPAPGGATLGLKLGIAAVALTGLVVIALGAIQIVRLRGDKEASDNSIALLTSELRLRNQMIEGMRLASKRQAEFLKIRIERLFGTGDPIDVKRADDLAQLLEHEKNDAAALSNKLLKVDLSRRAREPAAASTQAAADGRERPERREGEREIGTGVRAGGTAADDNPYAGLEPVAEAPPPRAVSGPAVGTGKSSAEIDDLIDNALTKRAPESAQGTKEAPMPMPAGDEPSSSPAKPSRENVQTAMGGISSQVKACAPGQQGRIVVKVTVQGATGRVTAAEVVDPEHVGTPAGVCAARAAKLAKFPRFTDESLTIKYPFDL
ncbi:MAG: hypothetical protein PHU25_02030 [Deltaproteobacteria bacterium]|nr:hypothetical protein [Deltaproteobacteria bacterium]